jgi:hypothetical protein
MGAMLGGRASKKCPAIMALVRKFAQTQIPALKIFGLFPLSENEQTITLPSGDYGVYRDGDRIVQVDREGHERSVGIRTIERYVIEARKSYRKSRTK